MTTSVLTSVREMEPVEAVAFAKTRLGDVPEFAFQFLEDWAHHRDLTHWINMLREVKEEAKTH